MKRTKSNKIKYLKIGLGVVATTPLLLVQGWDQEYKLDKNNGEINYSNIYTPELSTLPGIHKNYNDEEKAYLDKLSKYGNRDGFYSKTLLDENVIISISPDGKGGFFIGGGGGKLDHINSNGELFTGWTTKTLLDGRDISSIVPDGQGGFFVGGVDGRLDHIDLTGELIPNWTTKTLLNGQSIFYIVPDGQGGFFVGGVGGKLDHINTNGDLIPGWSTKTLLDGGTIFSISSDGQGGFFAYGYDGKLDHIDVNGELFTGWTTKTLLGGQSIYSIASDGQGSFFVGGINGKLDCIDINGDLITGWSTKTLLDGKDIYSIVDDGVDGFFVGGFGGKLDHIDPNGDLIPGWSTKKLLNGQSIFSIVPDGQGGFFVTGDSGGKLNHIDKNGDLFGFNSWVKGQYDFDHDYNIYKELLSNDWTTKTLLDGKVINSIIPDGNGGFIVAGINGKLDRIDINGDIVPNWATKTLLGGQSIFSIASDGHGGFFVGGGFGMLDHIDANGDLVPNWTTKKFIGGRYINTIFPDGQGGFFIGGGFGMLDHIDANGNLFPGWTTKQIINFEEIYSISPDGQGGFFAYGYAGKIDRIDTNGDVVPGWSTKTLLGGDAIKAVIPDGNGGFFVGGHGGKLDHIDANGDLVPNWSTKTFLTKTQITLIVPDGQGNFFICGGAGKIDRIDKNGELVTGWSEKTVFNGQTINSIVPDGQGGFFIGGYGGKLDHLNSEADLFKAESEEETKQRWSDFYPSVATITAPVLSGTNPIKDEDKGRIVVNNFEVNYAILKYQKNGDSNWIQIAPGVDITNLETGTYNFKWDFSSGVQTHPTMDVPASIELNSFDDVVSFTEDTTNGGTNLAQSATLPTGVSSITLDKTSIDAGITETVTATITYASGHFGPSTVVQNVTGTPKNISPTFDDLVTSTEDITNGGTTLAQSTTLPIGVSSISLDKTSVSKGLTETIIATITYASGYSGSATVSKDILGAQATIVPTFDDLVTFTPDVSNSWTSLSQSATLPTGVSSISLDKTHVVFGTTETVIATITYASGYTGPDTISQMITGGLTNISPTFDDLVISTEDTINGGTTLSQIDTLPIGVSSISLDKTKVDAGTTETVTATITYAPGYTGLDTISQDVTGASKNISPTFDDLVTSTEDITNGRTTLAQSTTLPTGVSSIALDKTHVVFGTTETVIATITYASGYTGPDTVSQMITGGLTNIFPTFDELVTSTEDTINGGTTLSQIDPLPIGVSSISLDKTSVSKGLTETIIATITYASGYTGLDTVSQDVTGASQNISHTFDQLVTSTKDTTNGGTTLAQSTTLPTGVSSIALDKTHVVFGTTETVTATITYAPGYTGLDTVSQDVTGTPKNISPTFDDLVTSTKDDKNGGTTLLVNKIFPTGVVSVVIDKSKVDAGITETVTATITYASGYIGPNTVSQDVIGTSVASSSSNTLTIVLAVILPLLILPLLGFAGYKLFKWRKNK